MYSELPVLPSAMLHNSRSRGSHTKESLISGPSSILLSVSLDTLSGKFPVWLPAEADDPPHPIFGSDVQTNDATYTTQARGYDKVYYLPT